MDQVHDGWFVYLCYINVFSDFITTKNNMASLIPGFEYDIFISYRQKDNKGDMWVSTLVEALKTGLESTFI